MLPEAAAAGPAAAAAAACRAAAAGGSCGGGGGTLHFSTSGAAYCRPEYRPDASAEGLLSTLLALLLAGGQKPLVSMTALACGRADSCSLTAAISSSLGATWRIHTKGTTEAFQGWIDGVSLAVCTVSAARPSTCPLT